MTGKDLPKVLKIAQDSIQVEDPELEEKAVRMTFRNFGSFRELDKEEKREFVGRMKGWIDDNKLTLINHDDETGDLVVEDSS